MNIKNILMIFICSVFLTNCVSLNQAYNNDHQKIYRFCKRAGDEFNFFDSKTSRAICVVEATKVQRDVHYERYLWFLYGIALVVTITATSANARAINN